MGNDSKVLTVSYGTFSCTLEGFTDSFGAMKAIAEYFRDLASDDRYFAANPPELDAEIISELASRNSSQKLTARTQGTNVVLSPADPETTEPGANGREKAPVQNPSLTERLERLRAVSTSGALIEDENENENVKNWSSHTGVPEEPVENFFAGPEIMEPDPNFYQDRASTAPTKANQQAAPSGPLTSEMVRDQSPIPPCNQLMQSAENPQKNMKIEQADDGMPEPIEIIFDVLPNQEASIDSKDSKSKSNGQVKAKIPIDLSNKIEVETEVSPAPDSPKGDEKPQSAKAERDLKIAKDGKTSLEESSQASNTAPVSALDNASAHENSTDRLPAATHSTRLRPVVKVVPKSPTQKDRRAQDLSRQSSPTSKSTPQTPEGETTLTVLPKSSQEQRLESTFEDELTKILSQEQSVQHPKAKENTTLLDEQQQLARERTQVLRQEHQDVSRLLKQTDQKMAHPRQSRRRNALAHLRAAVAANKGELSADPIASDIVEMPTETLRDVNSSPSHFERQSETEKPQAPEPLRLVENQRIDTPEVTAPDTAQNEPIEEPIDFATYAQIVGANTLEAQIEAVASYLTLVLKRKTFARRNLFSHTRHVAAEPFVRKKYMRIFYALVEQGKILDLGEGNFKISDDTIGYQWQKPKLH